MWQIRTEHYSDETDQLIRIELWDVEHILHGDIGTKIATIEFDENFSGPGNYGVRVLQDRIEE